MKREELTELGVAPELLDPIMALNGRDIEKHKAAAQRWEEKYGEDTAALKAQLGDARYTHAADRAVSALHFSSESAKKTFCAELKDAALAVEEDSLSGFDAFVSRYREKDPAAFADTAGETPMFVRPSGGTSIHNGPRAALRAAFGLNN